MICIYIVDVYEFFLADLEMVEKNVAYKWSRLNYLESSFELYFGVKHEIVQNLTKPSFWCD